ncbi:MAG: RNA polymerase sigma factor RpoH [Gammaproteobacteria bacterium]
MNKEILSYAAVLAPVGNIQAYMDHVHRIPMLSAEEEQALGERLVKDNDIEAARQLVLAHLRYVVRVARGYMGYGLPLNDLIQEGNVGLMKAVKRFDPTVGVRLVSFAVHWIKAEIHEFVLRNWRIVKVATTKAQRKLFFGLRRMKKRLGWFTNEEVSAVARDLGVSAEEVLRMEQRLNAMDSPYDISDLDDDDSHTAPAQYLQDNSLDPAVLLEKYDSAQQGRKNLHAAMQTLDARSQHILEQRWLTDKKMTLHELAAHYQISAERIRQLENNALRKLRKAIEN